MTEPVAYLVNGVAFNDIDRAKVYSDVLKYHKKIDIDTESLVPIPLYTADQLQNKIELTKDEFELLSKVCHGIQPFQKIEQHIKLLPDKKWFVRSKETNRTEYNDFLLLDSERIHGWYPFVDKKIATQFDTKEEAEKWTNPLTEVVKLPVEGE